ncbi:MAG: beta-lactamase family protein [Bacteroidetes bacterium]|nr:beta-lactamase family protein [Bacteroidota bacterium]
MKKIGILLLIIASTLQTFSQNKKQIAEDLKAVMAKYEAIGASFAVLKGNKIVYHNELGFKDRENNIPLSKKDIFRIASISKSFTTTSLLQLVEAGKISLDDDISSLVGFPIRNPNFPDRKITLQMLLSHRSSLNDSNGYTTLDVLDSVKTPTWANSFNKYAPGEGYMYCNLNYNLAGTILERISGERFDRYVQNHILKPLKLYGGYWVDGLDSSRFVHLYAFDAKNHQLELSPDAYAPRRQEIANYRMGYSTPILSPTGGMKISAIDLARYMGMHMNYGTFKNKKIISEESSQKMQTILTPESSYGMAMEHSTTFIPGIDMTGHTGVAYGLFSAMFFNPKEKYGFVVITNGLDDSKGKDKFLSECMQILYKAYVNSH